MESCGSAGSSIFYKWSLFGDIGISRTSEDNAIFPIFDSWIYSDAGRAERRCSVRGYTVEMSFLTPIIMLLVMSSIYAFFYYHDKNIIAGEAIRREKNRVHRPELEIKAGQMRRNWKHFFKVA